MWTFVAAGGFAMDARDPNDRAAIAVVAARTNSARKGQRTRR
jgi:hypothetical protein